MDAWEVWRAMNMALAASALLLNVLKAVQVHLLRYMAVDASIGFLGVLAWCLGYILATTYAWAQGVPAGPWTAIMTVPIMWTLIAGFLRSEPKGDRCPPRST